MKIHLKKYLFWVLPLAISPSAHACNFWPLFENNTDKQIHLVFTGPHGGTLDIPAHSSAGGGYQCTSSSYNVVSIDGYTNYAPYFTVTSWVQEATVQHFPISQGPQYGVDFMNASHRTALDQDNHAAALAASIKVEANQVAAIQTRSANLVKQQVDMKSAAFTSLVSKDVTAKLSADNLGAAVKSNIDTATAAYKKSTGDYFISNMMSTTLNNIPEIKIVAGQNTLSCGAGANDGVAYVQMGDNLGKYMEILLLSALSSYNPVQLDIEPTAINMHGGLQTYCFVQAIHILSIN